MKKFIFNYQNVNQIRDFENRIECLEDVFTTINRFIDYCKEISRDVVINQYDNITEIILPNKNYNGDLEFAYRVSSKMLDNIIKFYLNNNVKFLMLV